MKPTLLTPQGGRLLFKTYKYVFSVCWGPGKGEWNRGSQPDINHRNVQENMELGDKILVRE